MDFLDHFRRFLGLHRYKGSSFPNEDESTFQQHDRSEHDNRNESMGFNVFTSPLEMQRFFEKEMEDLMKNFGVPNFFNNLDAFKHELESEEEERMQAPSDSRSLRDQYLKPGYQKSSPHQECKDSDVDGKVDLGDVASILRRRDDAVVPHSSNQPKIRFFGQSMTSSTIRKPDGSVETRRTVRDKDGNEETTITHKLGDKEYSVTTRTDSKGQQETIENLIEGEKGQFFKHDDFEQQPLNWFPFDRFFK